MATTVSIEFTDEQWTLVQANYKNDSGESITKEQLASKLFDRVKYVVVEELKIKAATDAITAFDG